MPGLFYEQEGSWCGWSEVKRKREIGEVIEITGQTARALQVRVRTVSSPAGEMETRERHDMV